MAKFRFVVVSGDGNSLIREEDLDKFGDRISGNSFYYSNSLSLSRIINIELSKTRELGSFDFMVFMHGDVSFDIGKFMDHVESVSGKYDVIGLAGTKKMNVSHSPLNWFTSSITFPEERYGDITMKMGDSEKRCFYNAEHHPEVSDTMVACIDGLCIVFGRKVFESSYKMDETIAKFDFYDTQISLDCNLVEKWRLGVIVEPTRHISIGKSILSENFLREEILFRNKYGLDIPKDSKLEEFIKRNQN